MYVHTLPTPCVAQLQYNHHVYQWSLTYSTPNDRITSHRVQMISIQPLSHQYTIYDRKKNVVASIHKTIPKHAVYVCDSDDEI